MNILVIGGTRFIGVHLVKYLLAGGHKVTIATRGQSADDFGDHVDRIIMERTDKKSIYKALSGISYDVVYDSLAYCSNEIKYLLDVLECNRYIQISTLSVYRQLKDHLSEEEFDAKTYPLKWCSREDDTYDEIKRQAECALYQTYTDVAAVSVRFPYVIGEDDYTKRLYFYVEHIIKSRPMNIDNLTHTMAFVKSNEAGKFLAELLDKDFCGSINAASYGNVSLSKIIHYVENKTGIKAVLSNNGDDAPYNGTPTYSLDLQKAEKIGFKFSHLNTWLYELLDVYIDTVLIKE
ncbi:MAG: NAD-dependent epimerase/dehydratase family protein [Mobilitalea sp.]